MPVTLLHTSFHHSFICITTSNSLFRKAVSVCKTILLCFLIRALRVLTFRSGCPITLNIRVYFRSIVFSSSLNGSICKLWNISVIASTCSNVILLSKSDCCLYIVCSRKFMKYAFLAISDMFAAFLLYC